MSALQVLLYIGIALATLRLLLPISLKLFLPALQIGRLSPFTLGDIAWTSKLGGERAEERIQVHVGKVGWSAWGSKACTKGWFVLKLSQVRIIIPRAALLAPPRAPPPQTPRKPVPKPNTSSVGRLLHYIRTRILRPALDRLSTVASALSSALVLFAVEIDFQVELEGTLNASGILSGGVEVGGHLTKRKSTLNPRDLREIRLGGWLSLANLQIHEVRPHSAEAPHLPALAMRERLVVSVSAPLGPARGFAALVSSKGRSFRATKSSVRLSVTFGKGEEGDGEGVHVRIHELKRIVLSAEAVGRDRSKMLAQHRTKQEEGKHDQLKSKTPPLHYLRSVELSIPLFVLSAHYHTPLHILAASPKRPLPTSVAFAWTIKNAQGMLTMGGTSEDIAKEHSQFLGRGRALGVGAKLSWEEIEGRIKVDGSEEDILPSSAKAFAIGPSVLHVTSTWLPLSLVDLPSNSSSLPPRDYNDEVVIAEGMLGEVRGHITFETLDSALRIFMARPRPDHEPIEKQRRGPPPLRALPRLVGTIASAGIEIRIQAPLNSEGRDVEDDDYFFRSWTSPELFCISFPNGSMSFESEYSDRSVKRSEVDRRVAKRMARDPPKSKSPPPEEGAMSPTAELERALGVPPPPPITSPPRRHLPTRPDASLSTHLDTHPLRYTATANLVAETLNVYILATNHGTNSADDAAGWLDEKPTLPSDPIRLDILAIGPLEITTSQVINGSQEEGAKGVIAVLDRETHRGEVNILVEAIGIDLWRPLVMGSLRDFLSSFASASSTSTVRTPSSIPKPKHIPPKPLVETMPVEQCFYVAVASLDLRIAGSDPKNDEHACRGVALHSGPLVFEYLLQKALRPGVVNYANRHTLEMREDIRVEANANVAEKDGSRQALIKFSLNDLDLNPVVDARASRGHTRKYSSAGGPGDEGHEDWELKDRAHLSELLKRRRSIMPSRPKEATKGILSIPHLSFRVRIGSAAQVKVAVGEEVPLDDIVVSVEGDTLTLRVELFTIYLCLVAIAAARSLKPRITKSTRPPLSTPAEHKRPPPHLSFRLQIADLNIFPTLPHNVPLFAHLRRLRIQHSKKLGTLVEWDMFLLAGESPTAHGKWDDIIRLRVSSFAVRPEPSNSGYHPFVVAIASESARLRIPFRYVFSRIVDNAANLIKAVKQLVHQHVKGGCDSVLEPHIEEAKRLPKIEIKIRMFAIEIQDDPFETRLNIIWRAGYEEQSARIDRDVAFEAKVEAIRRAESAEGDEETSEDEEGEGHRSARGPKVDGRHSVPIDEAEVKLLAYNSSHWIKRIRNAIEEQGRRETLVTNRLYGTTHSQRPDSLLPINLLPASRAAPLARATLQDITFTLSRPSFPDEDLPAFMHDVGRGLPFDTQFSLLVPLHFSWKMDTVLVQLRDYPLPLLHIPGMPRGYDNASWECEADLVIGEEMGGPESVRRVPCEVVPAHAARGGRGQLYSIVVPRSAMPVKTYCVPIVQIRTPYATRIGWGNSVSPAIQDVAKVLDSLSKATPDPSERIGFWDKLRLQFHWRVQIRWEGEGSVHFHLKGTRDPYALTGFGAGFAKSWHGKVRFLIGLDNVDHEVIQIISREYVLGIPNLRQYVDNAATGMTTRDPAEGNDSSTQHSSTTGDPLNRARAVDYEFTKVCAKFINGVRWGVGAVLERACLPDCDKVPCREQTAFHRQCRFFDFKPHWKVHTKTEASIGPQGEIDDSFARFRSDFIHFSISLTSPLTLPLPSHNSSSPVDACEYDGTPGYNSMHFSPHANTHFSRWWKLFDSTMSLPIRQGKLFPSAQPPSKKFGKHCATIKYRFSLAPLFISHTYKQESWAEWIKGETTVLGVKGKVGRFNVDLHQREQEETVIHPATGVKKVITRKAFYMAEVDCVGVDLRAITACFKEPEKAVVVPADVEEDGDEEELPSMHDYTVTDEQLDWVDMDDFNDAVYTIPDREPQLRVLPFVTCPRFTYYRQIDVTDKASAAENEEHDKKNDSEEGEDPESAAPKAKTKFGKEPSHTCFMGTATDTVTVQIESAELRLAELERELVKQTSSMMKESARNEMELRIRALKRIIERLCHVRDGLARAAHEDGTDSPAPTAYDAKAPKADPPYGSAPHTPAVDDPAQDSAHLPHITSTLYQEWGRWENRYMVHNPQIQVTNITREVLLKYYYSSTDRRGFVYYLSASAIKFIRDLAKEHDKTSRRNWSRRKSTRTGSTKRTPAFEESQATNRLLDELIDRGGGSFWANNESADEGRHSFGDALDVDPDNAAEHLPEHFDLNSGHLCMFIKPQISLSSDVDDKSTVILTAFRAQVKVFSVVDVRVLDDPVNAEVLHQTFATLDGLQAFYPHTRNTDLACKTAFVPLETLVDLRVEPWGFDRVVPRTSCALRYDKFNQLRLSSKSSTVDTGGIDTHGPQTSHFQTGTDRVSVECDKFSVSANPDHFAAIYNVVTDLLLYSDPIRKSRNSKLEAVVFTHNFSDLLGVANIIRDLQQRIRAELYLQQLYQVHLDELDEEGRIALFVSRSESTRLTLELSLVIDAITKAQNINGASKVSGTTAGVQFEARASELVYHMLDRSDTPFAKFSVNGVEFSWISKQDSSISNRLVIKDLKALNSSPEHVFAEIISKNTAITDHELCKVDVFAAVLWNALPPVGGISIVEQFEVHLHPIRLQLEHRVGRQILDYLFVQRRQQHDDEQEEEATKKIEKPASSPHLRPPSVLYTDNKSVESLVPRSHRPRSILVGDDRTPNRSSTNLHSSAASIASNEHRLRKATSTEVLAPAAQEEGLDADEMRLRASLNKTFILVDFTSTVLCLTYRSEKDDHSSLPNIYNITYKTPSIQYRSKTWSFLDLLDELKKDTIKSVWSQKGALLGQLLQTAHRRLPLTDARAAAKKSFKSTIRARLTLKSSRPPPIVEPIKTSPLGRNSSTDPYSRPIAPRTPSSGSSSVDLSDDEEELPSPRRNVLDSLDDFVNEPEEMSIHSTLADASSGSRSPLDSDAEAHSLPPPRHRKLSSSPHPKHSLSLPPSPPRAGSISTDPLTLQTHRSSVSPRTEEEKARLLMGKSFE